jgi:hypothetical protein
MVRLDFRPDELQVVLRACASPRVDFCEPDYLREAVARRLEGQHGAPALAARVRALDVAGVEALRGHIREGLARARDC